MKAVVKIGGSLITFKDDLFKPDLQSIRAIAGALREAADRVMVVHGGGSFGHPVASRHGLSTEVREIPSRGVSETKSAMAELNLILTKEFIASGLSPYSIPPEFLLVEDHLSISGPAKTGILRLLDRGFTPITYGDVLPEGGGSKVISGDVLVTLLSEALLPRLAIFLMDEDGVLDSFPGGRPIPSLSVEEVDSLDVGTRRIDVTGGLRGKLIEAAKIRKFGARVILISGRKPDRLLAALRGIETVGTNIR